MRAKTDYIEVYLDSGGENRWRFRAGNHETMADSAESYVSMGDLITALEAVLGGYVVNTNVGEPDMVLVRHRTSPALEDGEIVVVSEHLPVRVKVQGES